MAIGKAAKIARNLQKVIQPKLDKKMLSDDFYKELEDRKGAVDIFTGKEEKFELLVYDHVVLRGTKKTAKEWLEWLDILRGVQANA